MRHMEQEVDLDQDSSVQVRAQEDDRNYWEEDDRMACEQEDLGVEVEVGNLDSDVDWVEVDVGIEIEIEVEEDDCTLDLVLVEAVVGMNYNSSLTSI